MWRAWGSFFNIDAKKDGFYAEFQRRKQLILLYYAHLMNKESIEQGTATSRASIHRKGENMSEESPESIV
jgi:hypothetical protein